MCHNLCILLTYSHDCRSYEWDSISIPLYARSSPNRRPAAVWVRIWERLAIECMVEVEVMWVLNSYCISEHCPLSCFLFKMHSVLKTGFCLWLQVYSVGPNWQGSSLSPDHLVLVMSYPVDTKAFWYKNLHCQTIQQHCFHCVISNAVSQKPKPTSNRMHTYVFNKKIYIWIRSNNWQFSVKYGIP